MVPVEQTCPVCNNRFMGSDMVGDPCMPCRGFNELTLEELTNAISTTMYYEEKETLDND